LDESASFYSCWGIKAPAQASHSRD